jgi:hypothetical protein
MAADDTASGRLSGEDRRSDQRERAAREEARK